MGSGRGRGRNFISLSRSKSYRRPKAPYRRNPQRTSRKYSGPMYRSRSRARSSSVSQPNDPVHREMRLASEMRKRLDGRSKFDHFRAHHFQEAGRLLSKAGFLDWETVSKLDEQTRKYLGEDLRSAGVTAIQLSLINETPQRYENDKSSKTDSSDEKRRKKLSLKRWLSQLRCDAGRLT